MRTMRQYLQSRFKLVLPRRRDLEWLKRYRLPADVQCAKCYKWMQMDKSYVGEDGKIYCTCCALEHARDAGEVLHG